MLNFKRVFPFLPTFYKNQLNDQYKNKLKLKNMKDFNRRLST